MDILLNHSVDIRVIGCIELKTLNKSNFMALSISFLSRVNKSIIIYRPFIEEKNIWKQPQKTFLPAFGCADTGMQVKIHNIGLGFGEANCK